MHQALIIKIGTPFFLTYPFVKVVLLVIKACNVPAADDYDF